MNSELPQQKVLLSYQNASYKRFLIYLAFFLSGYTYARLSPGSENGVPWYEKIILVVIFFSFFLSIFEGLFLLNAKVIYKRVEFDGLNLYITAGKKQTIVPLASITRIDMLSTGTGSRGTFSGYEISYSAANDERAWVYVTVYMKKAVQFEDFINLVKQQNPGVTVKKVTSSIDGLIKLFNRKKAAV